MTPPNQWGGSKRYSRSGCRSRCSLFSFLAKSLSMAITSVSNSAGVGLASAGKKKRKKGRKKRVCCVPKRQCPAQDKGRLLRTCGPVINVPVVTGLVDEPVVAVELLLAHAVQVLLGEEAEERTEEEEGG